ncbi:protein CURLY FLAG LEAF 1-like [Musa acuminata AAA Group]|uniref:protein CURLY FLAG LEAF 1-like n=1 Tax=Musa acuminata AAA Group TaxID=214697 RepID=UPI0031E1B556
MTAPNIEMISVFLRSCDLGRVGAAHLAEVSDESAGEVTVELNSETALPCHWEQCLDMRSGQVYYINRETGIRTTKDPRTAVATAAAAAAASYSSCYQSKQDSSSDDSCSEIDGSDDDENSVDTANSCLTSLSSTSSTDTAAAAGGSQILVSAGCRSCFMYFMIPKSVDACPKCGSGGFLKLGRHGCV